MKLREIKEIANDTGVHAERGYHLKNFANRIIALDRQQRTWVGLTDVLDFIEEFIGAEQGRHPMFSDGYDLALSHVKELVEAKLKEKNGL